MRMVRIMPSKFNGKINAPASRTHAQKLLFMAAMSAFPSCIKNVPNCTHIETALQCLVDLGCKISVVAQGDVYVDPFPRNNPIPTAELNFRDNAECCTMATALASTQGYRAKCTGSEALQKLRMMPLISRMSIRGVKFTNLSLPYDFEGRLQGGEYELEGYDGENNINALLMALPLTLENSTIKLSSEAIHQDEINSTIKALEQFGIIVKKTANGYEMNGKQSYQTPGTLINECDWNLSMLWLLAGAASGENQEGVTISGLSNSIPKSYSSLQTVMCLLSQDFKYLNFNAKYCPDMAIALAAMAIVKGSSLEITGIEPSKNRGSNRLKIMSNIARKFGLKAELTDDGLSIEGTGSCRYDEDCLAECEDDPWVFMCMALAGAVAEKPFCLEDEHGADQYYEEFLNNYQKLGGKYQIF